MNGYNTLFTPAPGLTQAVSYTGTAGNSTAFAAQFTAAWVVVTTDAFVKVGSTAVANQDMYLPAFVPVVLGLNPSSVISAVQVSAGGTMYVTPVY